ncbi:MAG: hypothetical protein RL385_1948 [Pseudomonadota bacterium]
MRSRLLRYALGIVLGACVVFAVASMRAVLSARAEVLAADQAFARGDVQDGLRHLRLGGRWDAPFNAYAQSALLRMNALGQAAEAAADLPYALAAYRSLHVALAASRSPFRTPVVALSAVDQRLAELMARDVEHGAVHAADPARVEAYLAGLQIHRPRTGFVLLAFAGLLSWVFGFAALVLLGIDSEGRVVRAIARPSFLCFAFGWVAFAVGLRLA